MALQPLWAWSWLGGVCFVADPNGLAPRNDRGFVLMAAVSVGGSDWLLAMMEESIQTALRLFRRSTTTNRATIVYWRLISPRNCRTPHPPGSGGAGVRTTRRFTSRTSPEKKPVQVEEMTPQHAD